MDLLIILLICCGLGALLAPEDKRWIGALVGFLLGPIGVIVAALIRKDN